MKPTDVFDLIADRLRAQGVQIEETLHGVSGRGADAWRAWEAFCEVAAVAADDAHVDPKYCDNDLLLHESGSVDGGYQLDFARQFSLSDDRREHAAGHLDSWKRAVEASNSFKAMQALGPDRFVLERG